MTRGKSGPWLTGGLRLQRESTEYTALRSTQVTSTPVLLCTYIIAPQAGSAFGSPVVVLRARNNTAGTPPPSFLFFVFFLVSVRWIARPARPPAAATSVHPRGCVAATCTTAAASCRVHDQAVNCRVDETKTPETGKDPPDCCCCCCCCCCGRCSGPVRGRRLLRDPGHHRREVRQGKVAVPGGLGRRPHHRRALRSHLGMCCVLSSSSSARLSLSLSLSLSLFFSFSPLSPLSPLGPPFVPPFGRPPSVQRSLRRARY